MMCKNILTSSRHDIPRAKTEQAHDRAYGFTLGLLDRAYGARPRKMLAHAPQLYRVDVIEEICRRWNSRSREDFRESAFAAAMTRCCAFCMHTIFWRRRCHVGRREE